MSAQPSHGRSDRLLLLLLLTAAVVLLGSCGDGSDDESADDVTEATDDETSTTDDQNSTDDETSTTDDDQSEDSTSTTDSSTSTSSPLTSTTIDKSTTTGASNPPSGDEPDYDPGLKPLVDQARADLVDRLGISSDQAVLVLAELRSWPNSANGCPQEGMQYLQVVTDGAEIIFNVSGVEYRYTTGGQIFSPQLCEN
jgi:hypothetical protein